MPGFDRRRAKRPMQLSDHDELVRVLTFRFRTETNYCG